MLSPEQICGASQLVEHLLSNGANLDVEDEEQLTPLAYAAMQGHEKVITVLLQNHARRELADNVGLFPIHHLEERAVALRSLIIGGVGPWTPKSRTTKSYRPSGFISISFGVGC